MTVQHGRVCEMQVGETLSFRQSLTQQLKLNADIIQSLNILRMTLQELGEYVAQQICENPLLEIDTEHAVNTAEVFAEPVEEATAPAETENSPVADERTDDEPIEVFTREIWRTGAQGEVDALSFASMEETFSDVLNEQIGALQLEEDFAILCKYIVHCLDRRGYLETSPAEIAEDLGCPLFNVMQALYLVQNLQPYGVGARSLQECLVLQLVESPHFNANTIKLVNEGLPLLANNNIAAIAELLGVDKEQAEQACNVVRSLNPIPSSGYYTGEKNASIVPDAVVRKEGGELAIVLNDSAVPRLELSRDYCAMLSETGEKDAKNYLRGKMADAKNLIKSVSDREKTVVRVLRQIIAMQPGFFEDGLVLKPMTMASVAEELGVHTSTVSRAVQGKYIVCAGGTLELRSLFSASMPNAEGEAVSASFIRQQIKRCIEAEDPAQPLSDEHLRSALQAMNIEAARRTVAKYREEMGIPSSRLRRKK